MSILIATPMYGNMCTAAYHKSLLRTVQEFERQNYEYNVMTGLNESLIERARNRMAVDFLETDYQKLLFIDADIEFDPDDVAMLLQHDRPVVAGIYAMKKPGEDWFAVWTKDGMVKDLDNLPDLIEATYLGTGFMLIDREILEKMKKEYPDLENEDDSERWGFFNRFRHNGVMLSEDYAFCQRVRDMGQEIYADTRINLIHHGTYPYGARET